MDKLGARHAMLGARRFAHSPMGEVTSDAGGPHARSLHLQVSALPSTPAIQDAIPMAFFGTTLSLRQASA
jgi:hypothetical protein